MHGSLALEPITASRNGTLSLIVGLGVKDRPSCNTITIVDKVGSKFESYSILAAYGAAEEVNSCVRDVKNNGNLDLVLNMDVGDFIGRCDATWPVIYGWTGDNYTNISGSFPEFYSNRLAEIARTKPSENDYQCLQAESARIQELLGVANSIALKTIVLIANSKDPNDRRFAADV